MHSVDRNSAISSNQIHSYACQCGYSEAHRRKLDVYDIMEIHKIPPDLRTNTDTENI